MIPATSYADRRTDGRTDRRPRSGVPGAGDGRSQQLRRAIPGARPLAAGGRKPKRFLGRQEPRRAMFPSDALRAIVQPNVPYSSTQKHFFPSATHPHSPSYNHLRKRRVGVEPPRANERVLRPQRCRSSRGPGQGCGSPWEETGGARGAGERCGGVTAVAPIRPSGVLSRPPRAGERPPGSCACSARGAGARAPAPLPSFLMTHSISSNNLKSICCDN